MKNYSHEIAQAIRDHLEKHHTHTVSFDESDGHFCFVVHLPGQISCVPFLIRVSESDYTVIARCPVRPAKCDAAFFASMSEFVCRANFGLPSGKFDLDFRNGGLQYYYNVDCEDRIPSQSTILNSISIPASMMLMYAPGIIDVLYRGVEAKKAVGKCEMFNAERFDELDNALQAFMNHADKESNNNHDDIPDELECDDDFRSIAEIFREMGCSEEEIANNLTAFSDPASDDSSDMEPGLAIRLLTHIEETGDDSIEISNCVQD